MKNLLTIILCIIFSSISLYSQEMYVGGALGTSKVGEKRAANVIPEFGYCFNKHNSLSISLGYATFINEDDKANHSLRVTPCYSYIIPFEEKWKLDINTSVGYARFFQSNYNRLGLYLGPQLEYLVKPQWTVWFGFDAFALESEWHDGDAKAKNINFNWFNTGINFGFYYYIKPKEKKQ